MQKGRYIIIVASIIWLSICIWQASEIGPATETQKPIADDHPAFIIWFDMEKNFYKRDNRKPEFYLIWGTKGVNRDEVNMWDYKDNGVLIWDE